MNHRICKAIASCHGLCHFLIVLSASQTADMNDTLKIKTHKRS